MFPYHQFLEFYADFFTWCIILEEKLLLFNGFQLTNQQKSKLILVKSPLILYAIKLELEGFQLLNHSEKLSLGVPQNKASSAQSLRRKGFS